MNLWERIRQDRACKAEPGARNAGQRGDQYSSSP
jgi:hypothetical protein